MAECPMCHGTTDGGHRSVARPGSSGDVRVECPNAAIEEGRAVVIHMGDPDARAEAWNEGFDTAIAQVLVAEHEEEYAYDWLQQQRAQAWDEAIHHVEAQIGGPLKRAAMRDNPYRDSTMFLARGLSPHAFEAFEGATGYTCTAMVMRDGGGDQCGLPPDHPLHR